MATSHISYHENGFWSNDTFIELAVQYLIDLYDTKQDKEKWMDDYIEQWLYPIAKGNFPGFIDMCFDEYLSSQDKINTFIRLIRETKDYLQTKGNTLRSEELNSFIIDERLQSKWQADLPAVTVIETLNRIEVLLMGQMPSQDEVAVWKIE